MDLQLQQALQSLPNDQRGPSPAQVQKLGELVDGDLPLQSFLEHLLPLLCTLFGGSGAIAWMRAQGAHDALFGVRYHMDQLLNSVAEQKKHERLVQFAWRQKQPMLAEPAATESNQLTPPHNQPTALDATSGNATSGNATSGQSGNSEEAVGGAVGGNPTSFPLLFGPLLHLGEPIAMLEVVLAGSSTQPLNQAQRQLYLRGAKLVSDRVYGGLRRRMAMPAATIGLAATQLEQLSGEIRSLHLQIRQSIENRLQQFHGWAFASLQENQAFAKLVQQLLESHGLRVKCPECGHPAILRCLRAGNAKHGAFVFDHYLDSGRTFHGGLTTVPLIRVVSKPARRPALGNSA